MDKPKEQLKAFIYARQSAGKEDAKESLSIQQQLINCRIKANAMGIKVVAEFTDPNISGATYPSGKDFEETSKKDRAYQNWKKRASRKTTFRQGLGNLLSRIDEVDYIIVEEMTRLHRSEGNSFLEYTLHEFLKEKNIVVIQNQGNTVDFSDFNTSLIEFIKTKVASEQEIKRKKKSLDTRLTRKNQGYKLAAFSYGIVHDAKFKYHWDHQKARIVKYIFSAYLAKHGINQIAYDLNMHEKIRKLAIGKCFYGTRISKILHNPIYCGYTFSTTNELIPIRDFPSLISYGVYHDVQEQLKKSRDFCLRRKPKIRRGKENYRLHPLSGLIYCGNCGKKMVIQTFGENDSLYYCQNTTLLRDKNCGKTRQYCDGYENDNMFGLKKVLIPLLLSTMYQKFIENSNYKKHSKQIDELNREIRNLKNSLNRIYQRFVGNPKMLDVLSDSMEETQRHIEKRENKILLLKEEDRSASEHDNSAFQKDVFLTILSGELDEHRYEELAREAFKKITIYENYIEIQFNNGDNLSLDRIKFKRKKVFPNYVIDCTKKQYFVKNAVVNIYFFYGNYHTYHHVERFTYHPPKGFNSNYTADSEWLPFPNDNAKITQLLDNPYMKVFRVD